MSLSLEHTFAESEEMTSCRDNLPPDEQLIDWRVKVGGDGFASS
jgi:hypothetical protein